MGSPLLFFIAASPSLSEFPQVNHTAGRSRKANFALSLMLGPPMIGEGNPDQPRHLFRRARRPMLPFPERAALAHSAALSLRSHSCKMEKKPDMFSMISRPSSRVSLRAVRFCQMAIV
jgi:hypothetical protein